MGIKYNQSKQYPKDNEHNLSRALTTIIILEYTNIYTFIGQSPVFCKKHGIIIAAIALKIQIYD